MGKGKISSTLIACITVGLAAIIAIAAVAINGMNSKDTVSGQSDISSSTDTADASSIPSDTTSSEESPSSSKNQTSSSSKNETSSSSKEQTSSNNNYTGEKVCYLTFDDGPSSKVTSQILSVLDSYNVKATFFVVGTGKMSMLKDIHAAGHAIGLHSDTHEWDIYKNTDAYFADLQKISDKVYEQTGVRSNIMRFPGGSSNTKSRKYCEGIMSNLVRMVESKGYAYFDWDVDSTDASGNNIAKDKIVNSVLKGAKNRNKICVLMHDTNAKSTTAEALPEIIEGLKEMGFTFKTLDKNSPEFHHGVNN